MFSIATDIVGVEIGTSHLGVEEKRPSKDQEYLPQWRSTKDTYSNSAALAKPKGSKYQAKASSITAKLLPSTAHGPD